MRKLTDEEISRVLGMADAGKLRHYPWGSHDDHPFYRGCGCVAGAVHAMGYTWPSELDDDDDADAGLISTAVRQFVDPLDDTGSPKYLAEGPDAVLRMLEKAGLA